MSYDILGLGSVAWDDLVYLTALPAENGQAEVHRRASHVGGTIGTALRAAASYGSRTAWAGVLGDDPISKQVRQALNADGIDLSQVEIDPSAGVLQTIVLVNTRRQTRTVLYEFGQARPFAAEVWDDRWLSAAKVLLIDHFGIEVLQRAVAAARTKQIPIVADLGNADWPGFDELLAAVDHLILSAPFACRLTDATDPAQAVARLWNDRRQTVIVTCGEAGCWYREAAMPSWATHHYPAPEVDVVDTTGCGDVFHGIYASTLAEGLGLEDRLQRATVAAALKATRYASDPLPTREEIETFGKSWPAV